MIGVRVPPEVRATLDALTEYHGTTISDLIRGFIEPYQLITTEEGQQALRAFQLAIALSTTVHKSREEFTTAKPPNGKTTLWNGLTVTEYETPGDGTRYVHLVRQREGQTRNEAITAYALTLWEAWATEPKHFRATTLQDLCNDNLHSYLIGYVNFYAWTTFPAPYEANLWRSFNIDTDHDKHPKFAHDTDPDTIPEASTTDEASFFHWATEYLTTLWVNRYAGSIAQTGWVRVQDVSDHETGMNNKHFYYPTLDEETNIRNWAKQWLATYRVLSKPTVELSETIKNQLTTGAVDILPLQIITK